MHSRIKRYQQRPSSPSWLNTNSTQLETLMAINQLISPDFEHLQPFPGYHTFNSGGDKQSMTLIDHSMHTPLPADVLLEELGVVNSEKRKDFSDHLPVWFRFSLTSEVRTFPSRKPFRSSLRLELDLKNEKGVKKYQEKIVRSVGKLDKDYRQLLEDKTIACSPSNSGAVLQLVMAHTVIAAKNPKTEKINSLIQEVNKPRSKKKHGYSGELAVLTAHKSFYENLIRLEFPWAHRRMRCNWNSKTYQSILTSLSRQWTKHYRHQIEVLDAWSLARAIPSPAELQTLSFHQISL
jgi:hypothetical protein